MTATLEEIYARIPSIKCKRLCQDSCGLISAFDVERARIRDVRKAAGLVHHPLASDRPKVMLNVLRQGMANDKLRCPYLRDGGCTIYSIRPAICHLWGVTEGMLCPWGCEPERVLSREEANEILRALERSGG